MHVHIGNELYIERNTATGKLSMSSHNINYGQIIAKRYYNAPPPPVNCMHAQRHTTRI